MSSGYKAINASTRSGDQKFCVSCFALESAIIKVAKLTKKANVVRGLSGKMSDRFQSMYAASQPLKAGDVIADPGFLSTTRNLDVATSGNYKGRACVCGSPLCVLVCWCVFVCRPTQWVWSRGCSPVSTDEFFPCCSRRRHMRT